MAEWISVIEKRPEIGEHVLVTDGQKVLMGYIGASGYSGPWDPRVGWMCVDVLHFDEELFPTHWMPLPKVPNAIEVSSVNSVANKIVEDEVAEYMKQSQDGFALDGGS